jgi:hypothetical protein
MTGIKVSMLSTIAAITAMSIPEASTVPDVSAAGPQIQATVQAGYWLGSASGPVILGILSVILLLTVVRLFTMLTAAFKEYQAKMEAVTAKYSSDMTKSNELHSRVEQALNHCAAVDARRTGGRG